VWVGVVFAIGFNCVSEDVLVFRSVGVMSIGVIGVALLGYVEGVLEANVYDCVAVRVFRCILKTLCVPS
jgi:hypothetical protein